MFFLSPRERLFSRCIFKHFIQTVSWLYGNNNNNKTRINTIKIQHCVPFTVYDGTNWNKSVKVLVSSTFNLRKIWIGSGNNTAPTMTVLISLRKMIWEFTQNCTHCASAGVTFIVSSQRRRNYNICDVRVRGWQLKHFICKNTHTHKHTHLFFRHYVTSAFANKQMQR